MREENRFLIHFQSRICPSILFWEVGLFPFGKMKVTVVSRSGKELIKGGIELKNLMGWLNSWYSHFGWNDPYMWSWLERTDISDQENSNDCGVFAMAFAAYCVHRLPFKFNQSLISYFRSKVVIEIFKRSWQLNATRLGLTELTSDSPTR